MPMTAFLATIVPILTAVFTGLTILAYKHPDAYRKIGTVISSGFAVLVIALISYNVALLQANVVVSRLSIKDFELRIAIDHALSDAQVPWWSLTIIGILNIYLIFIYSFPQLGITDKAKG